MFGFFQNDQLSEVGEISNRITNTYMVNQDEQRYERSQSEITERQFPRFMLPQFYMTRMSETIGKWTFIKLKKKLASESGQAIRQTIANIAELVVDPKRIIEAMRLKIVEQLPPFLLSNDPHIRENTAIVYAAIARHAVGRQAITNNPTIINSLIKGLDDPIIDVRLRMGDVMEILCHDYFAAKTLVESYGFLDIIATRLKREQKKMLVREKIQYYYQMLDYLCQIIYLHSLEVLLLAKSNVDHAIELGLIKILLSLLQRADKEVTGKILACLAILCQEGLENWSSADIENVLSNLETYLNDESKEVNEKAVNLLSFITVTECGKIHGFIFIDRLLELANNYQSRECCVMSIKALTNIAEVPKGRQKLLDHSKFIEQINTHNSRTLKRHKQILLEVIHRN